ncbi:hypothetical protein HYH03_007367 [Edaphochlamys debaryana]|uniref:Uncharacterized protein n=1 Tax=Edaphochlamys debaryana TaxID=47281 RepID=A0A835Y3N4_9CHLO|nr:hypothetical protein HYH03_007367 [Edaphochlamys debaryana]|eukprot:KAG2494602.1 hypothetical protein HYH03_007367 [Edaphochlamys debaryana]
MADFESAIEESRMVLRCKVHVGQTKRLDEYEESDKADWDRSSSEWARLFNSVEYRGRSHEWLIFDAARIRSTTLVGPDHWEYPSFRTIGLMSLLAVASVAIVYVLYVQEQYGRRAARQLRWVGWLAPLIERARDNNARGH